MDKGSCPEFVVQSADFEDSAAFFNFRKRRSRPGALLLAGPPHVPGRHSWCLILNWCQNAAQAGSLTAQVSGARRRAGELELGAGLQGPSFEAAEPRWQVASARMGGTT